MLVHARCFAILRELSAARCELDLPDGASADDAWSALAARFPALAPHRPFVRAARNAADVGWDAVLADGDEVAFLPPVSGGTGLTGLTDAPIDVTSLEQSVAADTDGALVTFVGRARNRADDGRDVVELEYEAFAPMAESVLAEIAAEAADRWQATVAVVHRTGLVRIGGVAVAIVTAAPHRAEAYEANRFVIEAIKERLPIWKRERFADGTEWKRPGA
ncbi:MAG TPA: molybdenum cofactor biosynthesis protein MoaE [Candidatus Limnocylindria bacterium]|nr:molybdenum cofactor biosynthesis protein MoaE [Candidatus Limnocylindria bacterium]